MIIDVESCNGTDCKQQGSRRTPRIEATTLQTKIRRLGITKHNTPASLVGEQHSFLQLTTYIGRSLA
jgi:hypothetical protein